MKYCTTCGAVLVDEAVICPKCGCACENKSVAKKNDASSIGFAFLGFFFPIAGLILYLVWKDETPKKAKSAGKGALIGFIVSIVISIVTIIASFALTYFAVSQSPDIDSIYAVEDYMEDYYDL